MNQKSYYSAYKTNQISDADQGKLILMMYDGAIQFITQAKNKLEKKDIAGMGLYLGKAGGVISELANSLDGSAGGDISRSLENLYNFITKELLLANIKKDPQMLLRLISMLSKLREAWQQIFNKNVIKITSAEEVGEGVRCHS